MKLPTWRGNCPSGTGNLQRRRLEGIFADPLPSGWGERQVAGRLLWWWDRRGGQSAGQRAACQATQFDISKAGSMFTMSQEHRAAAGWTELWLITVYWLVQSGQRMRPWELCFRTDIRPAVLCDPQKSDLIVDPNFKSRSM